MLAVRERGESGSELRERFWVSVHVIGIRWFSRIVQRRERHCWVHSFRLFERIIDYCVTLSRRIPRVFYIWIQITTTISLLFSSFWAFLSLPVAVVFILLSASFLMILFHPVTTDIHLLFCICGLSSLRLPSPSPGFAAPAIQPWPTRVDSCVTWSLHLPFIQIRVFCLWTWTYSRQSWPIFCSDLDNPTHHNRNSNPLSTSTVFSLLDFQLVLALSSLLHWLIFNLCLEHEASWTITECIAYVYPFIHACW